MPEHTPYTSISRYQPAGLSIGDTTQKQNYAPRVAAFMLFMIPIREQLAVFDVA
jgi:hypothetical protein